MVNLRFASMAVQCSDELADGASDGFRFDLEPGRWRRQNLAWQSSDGILHTLHRGGVVLLGDRPVQARLVSPIGEPLLDLLIACLLYTSRCV